MTRKRSRLSGLEKIAIVKRYVVERVPVSGLCDEHSVGKWTVRAELPARQLLGRISLPTSKYRLWRQQYGRPHAHNCHIPRDGWVEAWEKQAIIDFHRRFPREG